MFALTSSVLSSRPPFQLLFLQLSVDAVPYKLIEPMPHLMLSVDALLWAIVVTTAPLNQLLVHSLPNRCFPILKLSLVRRFSFAATLSATTCSTPLSWCVHPIHNESSRSPPDNPKLPPLLSSSAQSANQSFNCATSKLFLQISER